MNSIKIILCILIVLIAVTKLTGCVKNNDSGSEISEPSKTSGVRSSTSTTSENSEKKWPITGLLKDLPMFSENVDSFSSAYFDHLDYNSDSVAFSNVEYNVFKEYCDKLILSGIEKSVNSDDFPDEAEDVDDIVCFYSEEKSGVWFTVAWYSNPTTSYNFIISAYDKDPLGRYEILS